MNTRVTLIHLGCLALGIICIVLAFTVMKDQPEGQVALVSAATFVWGWLGFVPAKPVVDKIVLSMPPEEVVRIQSMKPPTPQRDSDAPTPPPPQAALR